MKVKIHQIEKHSWRNENPGEGGASYSAKTSEPVTMPGGGVFPIGTPVALGARGHKLIRVEGGFKSVPCEPVNASTGEVEVIAYGKSLIAK